MKRLDRKALRFDGRVAVVTGGGRGIGREYALLLAKRGASVVVNDLGGETDGTGMSPEPALNVAEEIRRRGGQAVDDTSNVATPAGAKALVEATLSHFGQLDIIVNNAGGGRGPWSEMIELNLSSTYWVCDAAWPHLKKRSYGRILTTSSAAGLFGMRPPVRSDGLQFFAYGAAKMGIVGLTRCLALEGARSNIKVNGVAPVAHSRMSSQVPNPDTVKWMEANFPPEHVASAAACFLHEECPVSGEMFSVGGGRIAKIVVGETHGYVNPKLTPEAVLANFSAIVDESDLHRPRSVDDEMGIYSEVLGTRGGPFLRRSRS